MKRAAQLFLILAVSFLVRPTFTVSADAGSCLYQCQGSTCNDFGNTTSMCMTLRAQCQAKCSQSGGGQHHWGAVAYSVKDQGAGWSYGYSDLARAKSTAMANCVKNGAACKVWMYYDNQCGAIAADGEKVGWGVADAKLMANHRAVQECKNGGGKQCTIQVSQCSR